VNGILDIAVPFIAEYEGFSATPYLDISGYWTIGYGARFLADGSQVIQDTPPTTRDEALYAIRDKLVATYLPPVLKLGVALTDHQAAALASFCYNVGPAAFRGSNVAEAVQLGRFPLAADRLLTWNKARDPDTHELRPSQGLINRRRAERALFLTEDAPAVESPTTDELNAASLARAQQGA